MANSERGAYEPRVNDISAFDADTDVDAGEEGSRLPLLIVIALLVLAAFGGVVWLAYTQGVERGRADAPRIAVAGGLGGKAGEQAPLTGLQIYQHPAHGAANSVPALRPTANAAEPPAAPAPSLGPAAATNPLTPLAAPTAAQPVPKTPPAPKHLAAIAPEAKAAPSSSDIAEGASTTAPAVSETSGIMLQIGSYKSDAEARQSWLAFKARHHAAANYQPDVKEVDLGAKGVWYRLRIGSFADKQSAGAVCEKLKQDGASCLVAR